MWILQSISCSGQVPIIMRSDRRPRRAFGQHSTRILSEFDRKKRIDGGARCPGTLEEGKPPAQVPARN